MYIGLGVSASETGACLGVTTGGGYDLDDRSRIMKSLIQVLLEVSQDKMYLRTFVSKLTGENLPFVLLSPKLSTRIMALPEGLEIYIYTVIHIYENIYIDIHVYVLTYIHSYI
jgi:hypothetical protein